MRHRTTRPMITLRSARNLALNLSGLAFNGLLLGASVLALAGCSVPVADLPIVGLPAGAPARPAEPGIYPAVHDVPAARAEPVLDPDQQVKIENDLRTARDRQVGAAGQSPKAWGKTSDTSDRQ